MVYNKSVVFLSLVIFDETFAGGEMLVDILHPVEDCKWVPKSKFTCGNKKKKNEKVRVINSINFRGKLLKYIHLVFSLIRF